MTSAGHGRTDCMEPSSPSCRFRRPLVLVAAALAGAFGTGAASALDETDELLKRAREGVTPTDRDRELAAEYLSEWTDRGTDDPTLRRAFERISGGLPPAGGQLPALTRLHDKYSETRVEAIAHSERRRWISGEGRADGRRGWHPSVGGYLKVAAAAGVVFAVGLGMALILRLRRAG